MKCEKIISFIKTKSFYKSYLITVGIFLATVLLMAISNSSYEVFIIAAELFDVPYGIACCIVGNFVVRKSRHAALGIMLGGVTPFAVVSIAVSILF